MTSGRPPLLGPVTRPDTFDRIADAIDGRCSDLGRLGVSVFGACPYCGGRVRAWDWRPGPMPTHSWHCLDCDRWGSLLGLLLAARRRSRSAA